MADVFAAPQCSMRTSSLSSLYTDDVVIGQPILRQQSPSPARGHALEEPPKRRRPGRRSRPVRLFQSMCLSLPVLTPRCGRLPAGACPTAQPVRLLPVDSLLSHVIASSASGASSRRRVIGTLFGYRDGRVALSLQETPRCLPTLVLDLALPTHALFREIGTTASARIVLESEKSGEGSASGTRRYSQGWLLEEPMWTMFCNGKRVGYAVRRGATDEDLTVMETLWAVSMGGGVIPGMSDVEGSDGEMTYMLGCFEHIVGSRDSESLYMVGPHGGNGPELAIFFVRL